MELSATGRVILGMVAFEPRSGYDIKQAVDHSTRFFWAASYGQIYPELKRLAAEGLIEPDEESEGGRRRTAYRITDSGRDALAEWIRSPNLTNEMRDEGLLKVFFAGVVEREDAIAVLEAARAKYAEKHAALLAIEPLAEESEHFGPLAVLRYGLGMTEFAINWCDENLNELKEKD
jgi:PadR family transcriptional regulator, regulatory protein AphA